MVKNAVKSSVINLTDNEKAFLDSLCKISNLERNIGCVDGKIIGTGRADYTQGSTEYKLLVNDNEFLLIDIPGIEGDESKYETTIKDSLRKAHLIFYVNGSGKKAEKSTLEKIKKYMHDRTSVYALFNVHCPAKLKRVEGIDKTYEEELSEAYKKQNEIVVQTEKELQSFLGENFIGSVSLNGLLSFCTVATDSYGNTTIFDDNDKNLRSSQLKFLNEYSGSFEKMRVDSHIKDVQDIIVEKIEHFDEYILDENLKKLKTRLSDVIATVTVLKNNEKTKISNFLRDYDEFEKNCENAKDDFVQSIQRIGRNEVESAFFEVQEALFHEIELSEGKIKDSTVEYVFNQHKNQIVTDIQSAINNKVNEAVNEYQEAIQEAEKRLFNDLQREQKKFEISMQTDSMMLDTSFVSELDFTAKDFLSGVGKIGLHVLSGVAVGTAIPVLGNILGGVLGFLVGLGDWLWGLFASKEQKINKAKEKLRNALDDQIDSITDDLKDKISELDLKSKIEQKNIEIQNSIEQQRAALNSVKKLLDTVTKSLNNSLSRIYK